MTATAVFAPDIASRYPYGYAVVDVETTGLHAGRDRVLQVAVVQMAADGRVERTWSTLLDPGCDPGPIHIHGLSRQRLAGSPCFADVAPHLGELLAGRIFTAHNARFDWDFLCAEFSRAASDIGVQSRLCTIALTRRLDLPLASMSLAAVSGYWGVPQMRAHDATDDARVTVEILRHSLVLAHRLGAPLPIAEARRFPSRPVYPVHAPRPVCPWRHPGRWQPGAPLVQGMTVAFTGPSIRPRELLIRDATSAGLDVMNSVSSRTSVVVANELVRTGKRRSAEQHGTAVVDERTWLQMLERVSPGIARTATGVAPAVARTHTGSVHPARARGPFSQRRVLVLGGPHAAAVAVRERVVGLGGQAAVNLTASVTGVVLLDGAAGDARYTRARATGCVILDPASLEPLAAPDEAPTGQPIPAASGLPDVVTLARGAVVDLPSELDGWSLAISWADERVREITVDVVAFVVDPDEQVRHDEDFCFFNQPVHPSGAVNLDLGVSNEALAVLTPSLLPTDQKRVVLAAAIDGPETFGDVGAIELALRTSEGALVARATLDAATSERTLHLATLYDRSGTWRFRAVGQGYSTDLRHLAVRHGVDIED